jgi:hypothetical protein
MSTLPIGRILQSDCIGRMRAMQVRHPTIVALFLDYFNAIWRVAKPIKQGDVVKMDLLKIFRQPWRSFHRLKSPPHHSHLQTPQHDAVQTARQVRRDALRWREREADHTRELVSVISCA